MISERFNLKKKSLHTLWLTLIVRQRVKSDSSYLISLRLAEITMKIVMEE